MAIDCLYFFLVVSLYLIEVFGFQVQIQRIVTISLWLVVIIRLEPLVWSQIIGVSFGISVYYCGWASVGVF